MQEILEVLVISSFDLYEFNGGIAAAVKRGMVPAGVAQAVDCQGTEQVCFVITMHRLGPHPLMVQIEQRLAELDARMPVDPKVTH